MGGQKASPACRPVKIRVQDLHHRYGTSGREVIALEGIDLTVHEGEFVSLIGPSGCGKTSLLHIIAGLAQPTAGRVEVYGLPSPQRLGKVAYMFQRDLLLPWKSVLDNVVIGLRLQGLEREDAYRQGRDLLARFGLAGFADAYPAALSGGMRQRAALLRTFLAARAHRVMLLDEPLGALDSLTRMDMQEWLQDAWTALQSTVLMVTHDIDEAIFLSDRVYVMTSRPGRIAAEFEVPLPRPRRRAMMATPVAAKLKEQALAALQEGAAAMTGGGR